MKIKLMVGVSFVLFVTTVISYNGRSYTIAVIREINAEIIFMRGFLTVIFLFIEVIMKLHYPLLLIRRIYLIIIPSIRYEVFLVSFLL